MLTIRAMRDKLPLGNFMQSVNVRISSQSYQVLKTLSKEKGQTMQSLIDQALEDLRRRKMLEATNDAFKSLKSDIESWNEELAERKIWENTLSDGVENE